MPALPPGRRIGAALRIARAELRGGREALPVFLLCLTLGVAAVAGVASTLTAIGQGLSLSARDLLGGDVEVRLVHRFADDRETVFLDGLGTVSRAVTLRGMLAPTTDPDRRTLVQLKGVDEAYPLYGAVTLEPEQALATALAAGPGGTRGVALAPELAARLALAPGDRVRLGNATFEFRAVIASEPDRATGGMQFGPRVLVDADALASAGLLQPGSLFYPRYRIRTDGETDLPALRQQAAEEFPDSGWRWRDRTAGVPGVEGFVARLGSFLSLVALAALALGGIGAGSAIRAYLQRKTAAIATLRALGADRATLAIAYLAQTLAVATLGVAGGLLLGAGVPFLLGPSLSSLLPVPAVFGLYPAPLLLAAAAGYLTALLFSLAPLAGATGTRPAAVFRVAGGNMPNRLSPGWLAGLVVTAGALLAVAWLLSGNPWLTVWFAGGFAAAILLLTVIGRLIARGCAWLSPRLGRAPASLRRAVAQIGGAGGDASGISVSLGTAIALLAAVALIAHSLRAEIDDLAEQETPDFFVLDLRADELPAMRAAAGGTGAGRVETAPMLRGFITRLNGVAASEAEIDEEADWVLRGDRGLSYAAEPPPEARLVEGGWWPAEYRGPPLVSFAAGEARELGLGVGDTVTVSVLGRPLTATVHNLREVAWRGLGINFLMIFDPASLSAAPSPAYCHGVSARFRQRGVSPRPRPVLPHRHRGLRPGGGRRGARHPGEDRRRGDLGQRGHPAHRSRGTGRHRRRRAAAADL